jgi:LytR cell envelope-related transcriptional attenuator
VNLIQQIGAYAGFAAVVGLAVLSALYFSQARDLRRLREWAARSPERSGGGHAPDRPSPARQNAAEARAPEVAAPVASAGGAGPATAQAGATQPGAPAVTALRPGAAPPPSTQPGGRASARPGTAVAPGGGAPRAPSSPPRAAQPRGVEAAGRSQNGRPSERSSLPYVMLAVVGLLIVLGAAAFALGLVGGRSEPAPNSPEGTEQRAARDGNQALAPGQVTFSVLNGTTVDGLGKQVADELEAAGYRRGNVTNAGQQRTTSVVMYAQGAQADARAVARRLDIRQTEQADSGSQTLAGDATVIVLVGADRTQ